MILKNSTSCLVVDKHRIFKGVCPKPPVFQKKSGLWYSIMILGLGTNLFQFWKYVHLKNKYVIQPKNVWRSNWHPAAWWFPRFSSKNTCAQIATSNWRSWTPKDFRVENSKKYLKPPCSNYVALQPFGDNCSPLVVTNFKQFEQAVCFDDSKTVLPCGKTSCLERHPGGEDDESGFLQLTQSSDIFIPANSATSCSRGAIMLPSW